jgi:hypothetical protein
MARILAIVLSTLLALAIVVSAARSFEETKYIDMVTDKIQDLESSLFKILGTNPKSVQFAEFALRYGKEVRKMGNVKNAAVAFIVPWPSIIFYIAFLNLGNSSSWEIRKWCSAHPISLLNILFFFNVDIIFWIISLLHKEHLVDRFVLDCFACDDGLLLCHSSLLSYKYMEIEGCDISNMCMEHSSHTQLLQKGRMAVGSQGGLEIR